MKNKVETIQFMPDKKRLYNTLKKCWSVKSSTKWEKTNPSKGQCSVTALVIHDYFGGSILKTKINGVWHFYNKINDKVLDLTSDQFDTPIVYQDLEGTIEEALTDCSQEQYEYLKTQFELHYFHS